MQQILGGAAAHVAQQRAKGHGKALPGCCTAGGQAAHQASQCVRLQKEQRCVDERKPCESTGMGSRSSHLGLLD